MKPYDANGKTILKLSRDNKTFGDVWILTDGYRVSIREQKSGEAPTQGIMLSRAKFNRVIDWYLKNQTAKAKSPRPRDATRR
jgi:hypothetical protein